MDSLDVLTGRGPRKTRTIGEDATLLPRERLVTESGGGPRAKVVDRFTNLTNIRDKSLSAEDREAVRQLNEARANLRKMRDDGSISEGQFRKASKIIDDKAPQLKTNLVFGNPDVPLKQRKKEIARQNLSIGPRRTTKQTPEIVGLPRTINVKERAEKKADEARERKLKTQKVKSQAGIAQADTEGMLEDN